MDYFNTFKDIGTVFCSLWKAPTLDVSNNSLTLSWSFIPGWKRMDLIDLRMTSESSKGNQQMFRSDRRSCRFIVFSEKRVERVDSSDALVQTNPIGTDLRYETPDTPEGIRCRFGLRLSSIAAVHNCADCGRTEGVMNWSCRLISRRQSQSFSVVSHFLPQCGHFHTFDMNYSRPVFLLFSLVFIKSMSGELLCPSVDDKKQDLKKSFFWVLDKKMQLLQHFKQSKDAKTETTTVAPGMWYMEASGKNVL